MASFWAVPSLGSVWWMIQLTHPTPFPSSSASQSVCTSINEIICHGIPDRRKLQEGDIVNVDVSVYYKGYHGEGWLRADWRV